MWTLLGQHTANRSQIDGQPNMLLTCRAGAIRSGTQLLRRQLGRR